MTENAAADICLSLWADIQPQFANNSIATNMITSLRMFWIFRFLLFLSLSPFGRGLGVLSPVEGEKAFGLRHMFRDTVIFFVSLPDKNTRKSQSRLSSSARRMFSTDSSHIPRIFPAR